MSARWCFKIATTIAAGLIGVAAAHAQEWPPAYGQEMVPMQVAQSSMPSFVQPLQGPQGGPGSRSCPEFAGAKPIYASPAFDTHELSLVDTTADRALKAWNTPTFAMEENDLKDLLAHEPPVALAALKWQLHFQCDNPLVPTGALFAVWTGVTGDAPTPSDYDPAAVLNEPPQAGAAQQTNDGSAPWVEQ